MLDEGILGLILARIANAQLLNLIADREITETRLRFVTTGNSPQDLWKKYVLRDERDVRRWKRKDGLKSLR